MRTFGIWVVYDGSQFCYEVFLPIRSKLASAAD